MYTTTICPYCIRAKNLLQQKGVQYEELNIELNHGLMHEMMQRSQRRTVPQIFIDDYHVGGYDDMAELDSYGKLDGLLGLLPDDEPHGLKTDINSSDDSIT
jgi:glutaredoxin 3